jgi:hypothetical protein
LSKTDPARAVEEEDWVVDAGANAAADAVRRERIATDFMVSCVIFVCLFNDSEWSSIKHSRYGKCNR